jgi:hypothetical protein
VPPRRDGAPPASRPSNGSYDDEWGDQDEWL